MFYINQFEASLFVKTKFIFKNILLQNLGIFAVLFSGTKNKVNFCLICTNLDQK